MGKKKKYLKLLNCHLIEQDINFYNRRRNKDDIKFRFEREGSYLNEYYLSLEDAIPVVKLNTGNRIYQEASKRIVYSLQEQILCIVSL